MHVEMQTFTSPIHLSCIFLETRDQCPNWPTDKHGVNASFHLPLMNCSGRTGDPSNCGRVTSSGMIVNKVGQFKKLKMQLDCLITGPCLGPVGN